MSAPPQATTETAGPWEPTRTGFDVRAAVLDAALIGVWFVVLGLLGALLWWKVVDLPRYAKLEGGVGMGPEQLVKQVSIDGWYFVIAAVAGLLSGVALSIWRRRDPVVTVVLVVAAAALAAYLMVEVGLLLGPDAPQTALRSAAQGASAPSQLRLEAPGIAWVWPIAGALGCLFVLWVTPGHDEATTTPGGPTYETPAAPGPSASPAR